MASLINLFLRSQTESNRRSPLKVSPSTYHMGDGGWNRRVLLSCYCEVVVFFASYRRWRFNEADPLDSQHKHDLSLSNPKRPHVVKWNNLVLEGIHVVAYVQNIIALDTNYSICTILLQLEVFTLLIDPLMPDQLHAWHPCVLTSHAYHSSSYLWPDR